MFGVSNIVYNYEQFYIAFIALHLLLACRTVYRLSLIQ